MAAGGFFQGDASASRRGAAFHHNRVAVVGSQIPGVAPHPRHRWGQLRMSTTMLALERPGRPALTDLISHVVPAEDAPKAFEMLDTGAQDALQVILEYEADS